LSAKEEWKTVEWKDSIIGLAENFFLTNFNFHSMWARSLGTILASTALGNMNKFDLNDKWGDVYANLVFIYIGRSGIAIKTPPIKMLKKILYAYNKEVMCPTKFNSESFAEWVEGTSEKVGEKQKRKKILPHPINICVADEASRLLGDIKHNPNRRDLLEFISKLWDNEIEGKYTRGFQIEGNISVYFSMLGASSRHFYKLLEDDFFTQGLGNRIMWIVDVKFTPPKLNAKKFFYQYARDNKFNELKDKIVGMMRTVSEAYGIWIENDAGEMWVDFANKIFKQIVKMKEGEGEYSAKVALNALKLAMCYSASRLNISPANMIHIEGEDMQRAIADSVKYVRMWKLAMKQWEKYGKRGKTEQDSMRSSKYDAEKLTGLAYENGGTICIGEIVKLGYPDRTKIIERLNLAVTMGFLKRANDIEDRKGDLSDEKYEHYNKICRGNIPVVWRITEKGKKQCGEV